MVKTQDTKEAPELTRERICQYVWARYIDNTKPPFEIDEEQAVHFFEKYYAKHPLTEDEECFYYGILLYELAFSDDRNRARYLVKAKEVIEVYRNVTGETEWDVIEDRFADVQDLIESEGLLEKVQTAAASAPSIPGMVLVPGGSFLLGAELKESHLEPFYIDEYPVTNAQYRVFLEETNYRKPVLWDRRADLTGDDLPVTGVSWMDALQYCKWAKKSLPTAEQWEKAARGTKGSPYPWGDEPPTPDKANYHVNDWTQPTLQPAKAHDAFASPYGVKAMVGCVWEWTNTSFPEEEGAQVIKGGSFADPIQYVHTLSSLWANKKEKSDIIGFRCTMALES